MADFSVSDVASRVNAPQQISIGDMLNIARGAQAYKQAEQINPLIVQEQRAILQQQEIAAQKASRVLEPDVARTTAESKKSVLSAEQAGIFY